MFVEVPYSFIRALGPRGTDSVLSNWAREVRAFTEVSTTLIRLATVQFRTF